MAGKNGENQVEHPKTMVEVIEGTKGAIEGYAQAQKISETDAALILILNELRCIHWHLDAQMTKAKGAQSNGGA